MLSTHNAWVFGSGCLAAALFSYGLGANDVANSFGTSIGSGALTMRKAIGIAAVCEVLGAVTLGHGVADTLTKKISYLRREDCWSCSSGESNLMGVYELGMVCALASGALFLLAATRFGLPVSTTHTIVGAVLGMTIVGTKASCVKWLYPGLLQIVASWLISPIFAGILSVGLQMALRRFVLRSAAPLARAYIALPILAASSIAIVLLLVLFQGKLMPLWMGAAVSAGCGLGVWICVRLLFVPWVRATIDKHERIDLIYGRVGTEDDEDVAAEGQSLNGNGTGKGGSSFTFPVVSSEAGLDDVDLGSDGGGEIRHPASPKKGLGLGAGAGGLGREEDTLLGEAPGDVAKAIRVFMYLQVLTATLKSFAHGANDVANAAGPFAAIQGLYMGSDDPCNLQTAVWVLLLVGVMMVVGLAISGHHVIQTIGTGLTSLDFCTGFAVELGSTLSVVLASCFGMPVSSTHCQVGSVISIGMYEHGVRNVQWNKMLHIVISWLVTVPVAALVAAGLLAGVLALLTV